MWVSSGGLAGTFVSDGSIPSFQSRKAQNMKRLFLDIVAPIKQDHDRSQSFVGTHTAQKTDL